MLQVPRFLFKSSLSELDWHPSRTETQRFPADVDDIDKAGFQEDIKVRAKDKRNLEEALVFFFDGIWGQHSPTMQVKLKSEFTVRSKCIDDKDVTLLLKAIKGVSHRYDSTINPYEAVDEGK